MPVLCNSLNSSEGIIPLLLCSLYTGFSVDLEIPNYFTEIIFFGPFWTIHQHIFYRDKLDFGHDTDTTWGMGELPNFC